MSPRLSRRRMRTRRQLPASVRPAPVVVERGRMDMDRAVDLIVRELDAVEVEPEST